MKVFRRIMVFALAMIVGGVFMGGVATAETIKIGMVQPLTGPVSFGGNTLLNGARMAVEEINAAGGVLGKNWSWCPRMGSAFHPRE